MIRYTPSARWNVNGDAIPGCDSHCYCEPPCEICEDFWTNHTNYGIWADRSCPIQQNPPLNCLEECRYTLRICNENSPEPYNHTLVRVYADSAPGCLECCPDNPVQTGLAIEFPQSGMDARLIGILDGRHDLNPPLAPASDPCIRWHKTIDVSPAITLDTLVVAPPNDCPKTQFEVNKIHLLVDIFWRDGGSGCLFSKPTVNIQVIFDDDTIAENDPICTDPNRPLCCSNYLEFGHVVSADAWSIVSDPDFTQAQKDALCAGDLFGMVITQDVVNPNPGELVGREEQGDCCPVQQPFQMPSFMSIQTDISGSSVWDIGPRAIVNFQSETEFCEARVVANPNADEIAVELWRNGAKVAGPSDWIPGELLPQSYYLEACLTKDNELRGALYGIGSAFSTGLAALVTPNASGFKTGYGLVGASDAPIPAYDCRNKIGFYPQPFLDLVEYQARRIDDSACLCPDVPASAAMSGISNFALMEDCQPEMRRGKPVIPKGRRKG